MGILEIFRTSPSDIISNKKNNRVYVGDFPNQEGKYISMVFDDKTDPYDASIKVSPKIEVRITYLIKDETISGVQISKVSGKQIERINISTLEFEGILGLLKIFSELDLKSISNKSIILDANIVNNEKQLRAHLNTILADPKGLAILAELAASNKLITEGDIGGLTRKKEAVALFEGLLNDDAIFEERKREIGKTRDEDVWQDFFQNNKWIFGYGLEYIFNSPITKDKYEQLLRGANFIEKGKRPDAILKTYGLAQFLNIAEIKTHKHKLIDDKQYRESGVWRISNELTGAILQCQQYVRASIKDLEEVIALKDEKGDRIGEEVFCFTPKCFLIIGTMTREFLDSNGKVINPDKLACYDYFRRSLSMPEILTFDQLFIRAKNIVENC